MAAEDELDDLLRPRLDFGVGGWVAEEVEAKDDLDGAIAHQHFWSRQDGIQERGLTHVHGVEVDEVPQVESRHLLERLGNGKGRLPDVDFDEQGVGFSEIGRIDRERIVGRGVESRPG